MAGILAPINNACPRCHWFRPDANDWPPWDGHVPVVRAPTFTVGTSDAATVRENARLAAVEARVASANKNDEATCMERIFAIFNGEDEAIPDEGLSESELAFRLSEFGFDASDMNFAVAEFLNNGDLDEYVNEAAGERCFLYLRRW